MSIIDVIEDKKPLPIPLVSQPVANELKYIRPCVRLNYIIMCQRKWLK
jgi:hypothetical protein